MSNITRELLFEDKWTDGVSKNNHEATWKITNCKSSYTVRILLRGYHEDGRGSKATLAVLEPETFKWKTFLVLEETCAAGESGDVHKKLLRRFEQLAFPEQA
jgi:hypothetical protein